MFECDFCLYTSGLYCEFQLGKSRETRESWRCMDNFVLFGIIQEASTEMDPGKL